MSLANIRRFCLLNASKSMRYSNIIRCSSFKTFENSPIQISVTDDGKTIVCWHPEKKFPYEHSKPLPVMESKFIEEESVLKLKHLEETDDILHKKDYSEEELMQLTYTPRTTWQFFNNNRKRKAHIRTPNPPIDRVGL
ncbi:39S ribosomal protein L42, mitochondrial [Halotydeus destructor]|nr:39S ribosomal protein L42, mitochondrial [Halotydeus destructor]